MATFIPTYDQSSIQVLLGYAGYGAITSGSNILTCGFNTPPDKPGPTQFYPSDVGNIITVYNAAGTNVVLRAKIQVYISFNQVQLDTSASHTATNDWANTILYRPVKVKSDTVQYDNSITDFDTASFTLESLDGSCFWPNEGQPILFQSADPAFNTYYYNVFFGGFIRRVHAEQDPGTDDMVTVCDCASWQWIAARRLINAPTGSKQWANTSAGTIFAALIAALTFEGCGVNAVTGPTITAFTVSNLTSIVEALNALIKAMNSSSTVYQWNVDPWRVFQLYQIGGTSSPWSARDDDGSDGNISIVTKVVRSLEKVTNSVTVDAAKTLNNPVVEQRRGVSAPVGGPLLSSRGFILAQTPDILPTATINGTAIVVGETSVDPTQPSTWVVDNGYGTSWKVNITSAGMGAFNITLVSGNPFTPGITGKTGLVALQGGTAQFTSGAEYTLTYVDGSHLTAVSFQPQAGSITGAILQMYPEVAAGCNWMWVTGKGYLWTDIYKTGIYSTDIMAVTYQTTQALTASYQNSSSMGDRANTESGSGIYETVLKLDQVVSQAEVLGYAQSTATAFGDIAKQFEAKTYRPGLAAGQAFNLKLTEYGINATYVVMKCSLSMDNGWPVWDVVLALGSIIGDWITGLIGGLSGGGGGTTVAGVVGSGGSGGGGSSSGGAGVPATLKMTVDLSSYTLPVASPSAPQEGQDLYVVLLNASGPVTWDGTFAYTVADLASGTSLLHFVGDVASGQWLLFDYRTGV